MSLLFSLMTKDRLIFLYMSDELGESAREETLVGLEQLIFEDDGEGVVPAETLDTLIGFGLTGFPFGELSRRTVDHVDLDGGGCLQMAARSSRLGNVDIEGYTPCRRDEDCPEGQTCNEALERCEDE